MKAILIMRRACLLFFCPPLISSLLVINKHKDCNLYKREKWQCVRWVHPHTPCTQGGCWYLGDVYTLKAFKVFSLSWHFHVTMWTTAKYKWERARLNNIPFWRKLYVCADGDHNVRKHLWWDTSRFTRNLHARNKDEEHPGKPCYVAYGKYVWMVMTFNQYFMYAFAWSGTCIILRQCTQFL